MGFRWSFLSSNFVSLTIELGTSLGGANLMFHIDMASKDFWLLSLIRSCKNLSSSWYKYVSTNRHLWFVFRTLSD